MLFEILAKQIGKYLLSIPAHWDGKQAILEMRSANFPNWRQMEWIGFYFQFLCERHLSPPLQIPGPRYGRVEFDGFLEIPWDFKTHAINSTTHQIILNDSEAIAHGIRDYGSVGVILALGKVEYNDEDRSFQRWHTEVKGGLSAYEAERIQRGAWSRLRKTSFDLQQISFIQINDETLIKCGLFQQDFRNSNGRPRKAKVLLDLEKLNEEVVYFVDF